MADESVEDKERAFCEFCGDELEEGAEVVSEKTGRVYCSTDCMRDVEI